MSAAAETGTGIPCPAIWYSAGDEQEHMCVLLLGHPGDCLCVSCGHGRLETEGRLDPC